MTRRTITVTDVTTGNVPADLVGVRWPDGTVECRFNVTADDYASRRRAEGRADHGDGDGEVLTGAPVDCDRCADKCN